MHRATKPIEAWSLMQVSVHVEHDFVLLVHSPFILYLLQEVAKLIIHHITAIVDINVHGWV